MDDKELEKRKERGASYRNMMQSWAWKDFEQNILNVERQDALEKLVLKNDDQLRGTVKCVDRIKSEIGLIVGE